MPFEFKAGERKHPKAFGGSPHKALLAEISDFAKQHRKHSLRRFAGMEKDEEETPAEALTHGDEEIGECPECKAGTCDNPEHMGEEDKKSLLSMLAGSES